MKLLSILLIIHLFTSAIGQSILFKNFRIMDGSGNKEYIADVRIKGSEIALIGNLVAQPNERVIQGEGKYILAPGFIDTHSHHDRNLLDPKEYSSFLAQGITTLIFGQDGSSHLPLNKFYEELETKGIPVNAASFIGHNSIRYQVLGNENFQREATRSEIAKMKKILKSEIKSGALGFSTGLEYDPGIFSSKEEVLQLANTAANKDLMYASHIRSEDVKLSEALDEVIEIGRRTKLPVHISHFKVAMKAKWGQSTELLAKLDRARSQGIQVTADVYPYDYWLSTLEVQFPKRDFDNKASAEYALSELAPPDGMILSRYDAKPEYVGKSIADIAIMIKKDPADTYMYLIKLARETKSDESVMGRSMTESDIQNLMRWPHTNICSDGFGGGRHPRGTGSFPRILNKYVKANHTLTWEEAIHKMTWLSAQHMGIQNRGKISQRYTADLIILDPETIADHSTLDDPYALSTGIKQVWVNGKQVWDENRWTGVNAGMVIKKI